MVRTATKSAATEGRRELILQATLRVIGTDGIDAVTHRRVANEAGVPLGSMTYYFDSRDDLVRDAFRYHLDDVGEAVSELKTALAQVDMQRDPAELVNDLIGALVELSETSMIPPRLRAEYEMRVYAGRDAAIAQQLATWQTTSNAVLAEALEILGVARPMEGARALIGAVQGFELERLWRADAGTNELRRRVEVTLAGLLGEPPAAPKTRKAARKADAR
jgi:DNA-binding transcriptional regulator YbjK